MNGFRFTAIVISISLVILVAWPRSLQAHLHKIIMSDLPTKTDNGSSIFLFVYTDSGGFSPTDKRISFNSFTNGLVSINNFPEHTYQIKTLDNSTIENIKKIIRDNNLFSVKEIYHTASTDIPVQKL